MVLTIDFMTEQSEYRARWSKAILIFQPRYRCALSLLVHTSSSIGTSCSYSVPWSASTPFQSENSESTLRHSGRGPHAPPGGIEGFHFPQGRYSGLQLPRHISRVVIHSMRFLSPELSSPPLMYSTNSWYIGKSLSGHQIVRGFAFSIIGINASWSL